MGAVGTKSRVPHFVVVLECVEWLSCFGVPDFRGVVEACGDGVGAVGTKSRVPHFVVVLEGVEEVDCSNGVVGVVVRKKGDECDEDEEGEDAEEEYEGRG